VEQDRASAVLVHQHELARPTAATIVNQRRYRTEVKITDDHMATIRLTPDSFHGDWNYTIKPRHR
jgi:hypothetical protein